MFSRTAGTAGSDQTPSIYTSNDGYVNNYSLIAVNLEIFASVLFSRNFACEVS